MNLITYLKITIFGNSCIFLQQQIVFHRMKVIFKDEVLLELYETGKTKNNKYKNFYKNKKFIDGYIRAVKTMHDV